MEKQIEGTAQSLVGKAQDVIGSATGDLGAQIQGKAKQVAGSAQKQYGVALDTVRDTTANSPLATIGLVAAVAFVLGALWKDR